MSCHLSALRENWKMLKVVAKDTVPLVAVSWVGSRMLQGCPEQWAPFSGAVREEVLVAELSGLVILRAAGALGGARELSNWTRA